MKILYLSQPMKKDKEQEIRLVRKAIMNEFTSHRLVYDQNHMYEWVPNNYPSIDKFIPEKKDYMTNLISRLQCMRASDYYIFIQEWKDFPECKNDWDILHNLGITNIIEFKVKQDDQGNIYVSKVI